MFRSRLGQVGGAGEGIVSSPSGSSSTFGSRLLAFFLPLHLFPSSSVCDLRQDLEVDRRQGEDVGFSLRQKAFTVRAHLNRATAQCSGGVLKFSVGRFDSTNHNHPTTTSHSYSGAKAAT
ncbi:hypothetical protein K443DRAFT_684930 [Laccaria amethystina LaAM-08-1]|uniref:Uncharacterized protein n=1 Tax=Laccaria amethystina LaAM-08-1 TaxID=1095629 RepID=A0A0C9WIG4_9AGAR|nr:hypothetical protein K443DRAFT_684930 [Laccaria amethystina LaAM-08-1]